MGCFPRVQAAAENFLLEYGNGMKCNLTGWGLITYNSPDCNGDQSFRRMEELHALYFGQDEPRRIHGADLGDPNLATSPGKAAAGRPCAL
jgi:hypothetical protein